MMRKPDIFQQIAEDAMARRRTRDQMTTRKSVYNDFQQPSLEQTTNMRDTPEYILSDMIAGLSFRMGTLHGMLMRDDVEDESQNIKNAYEALSACRMLLMSELDDLKSKT